MPRPRRITTEQIVDAARAAFLELGYGVATATIAQRAGVSEGTLFKRFPTKESLFFAAIGMDAEAAPLGDLRACCGRGDVRTHLARAVVEVIGFLRRLLPRMIVLWASPHGPPRLFAGAADAPPVRVLEALRDYLRREMTAGRVRRGDALAIARTLMGAAQNYVIFETLGLAVAPVLAPEAYARRVVDEVWHGLAPGTGAGGRT
jgi:AcrR family transcriptional regulator